MFDQTLVRSGFDVEILMSENYLRYLLFALFDSGRIKEATPYGVTDKNEDGIKDTYPEGYIIILPPAELSASRLYNVNPGYQHVFQHIIPPSSDADPPGTTPYSVHNNAFEVKIDQGAHLHRGFRATITMDCYDYNLAGPVPKLSIPVPVKLDVIISLIKKSGQYFLKRSLLSVTGVSGTQLADLKKSFEAETALNLGGSVEKIEIRKHIAAEGRPTAIGFYVNLKLKIAPKKNLENREENIQKAENFLPEGHDLAFGMRDGLLELIGNDIYHRTAREKEDGSIHHPLGDRKDPTGYFTAVDIVADRFRDPLTNVPSYFSNKLKIVVKGNLYQPGTPNFVITVLLTPVIKNGLIEWKITHDLDLPGRSWVSLAAAAIIGVLGGGPLGAVWAAWCMEIGIEGIETAINNSYSGTIREELSAANFFDTLPYRLTAAAVRWDPLYRTLHQVIALSQEFVITDHGIAGIFRGLRIDKKPQPLALPIRDKVKDTNGEIKELVYRIADYDKFDEDYSSVFPATDRADYDRILQASGIEGNRVVLAMDKINSRLKQNKILGKIVYRPVTTVRKGKIISALEIDELRNQLVNVKLDKLIPQVERFAGSMLRGKAVEELKFELGGEPTTAQVEERYRKLFEDLLESALQKELQPELNETLVSYARLDLQESEIYFLKTLGIISLDHEGILPGFLDDSNVPAA